MLILTISIATGPGHPSLSLKGPLPSMAHRVLPCAESPARDFGGIIFIYGGYCCPFDAVPNNNQGKWFSACLAWDRLFSVHVPVCALEVHSGQGVSHLTPCLYLLAQGVFPFELDLSCPLLLSLDLHCVHITMYDYQLSQFVLPFVATKFGYSFAPYSTWSQSSNSILTINIMEQ